MIGYLIVGPFPLKKSLDIKNWYFSQKKWGTLIVDTKLGYPIIYQGEHFFDLTKMFAFQLLLIDFLYSASGAPFASDSLLIWDYQLSIWLEFGRPSVIILLGFKRVLVHHVLELDP